MVMCSGAIAKRVCSRKHFELEREFIRRELLCHDPDYFYKNINSFNIEPEAVRAKNIFLSVFTGAGVTVYYGCLSGRGACLFCG